MRAGYVGVTVFFVISGFLITHLLLDELRATGGVRFIAFYIRRAYRLLPALFLALAILIVTAWRRHHPWGDTFHATVTALGYIFNIAAAHAKPSNPLGGAGWGHLWSLSVEEQFYIAWPLVIAFVGRRLAPSRLFGLLVSLALAITMWRTWLWRHDASFYRLYLMTDVRIDAIILGAALAVALRAWPTLGPRAGRLGWTLGPALVAVLVVAYRGSSAETSARPGWLLGPGMLIVSMLSVLMVFVVTNRAGGQVQRILDSPHAVAIGRRSYGLYLFHYPMEAITANIRGGYFLAAAGTVALTEASYRFIELPVLRRLPAVARRMPNVAG